MSGDVLLPLYKSLVRLHLQCCISAWSPDYQRQISLRMCPAQVYQNNRRHETAVVRAAATLSLSVVTGGETE